MILRLFISLIGIIIVTCSIMSTLLVVGFVLFILKRFI
jgi:hypothetical protein